MVVLLAASIATLGCMAFIIGRRLTAATPRLIAYVSGFLCAAVTQSIAFSSDLEFSFAWVGVSMAMFIYGSFGLKAA